MRLKIDWASFIVGRKFTVFALYLRAISKYKLPGGRGDLTEGFLRYRLFWAYIWRGLYMEGFIFGILLYTYIYTYIYLLFNWPPSK